MRPIRVGDEWAERLLELVEVRTSENESQDDV
jgi:hypothetical protein